MIAQLLTGGNERLRNGGLLVLRVVSGAIFIAHGFGDVFEAGVGANIQNYEDAGIPFPALAAPFAAYMQLVGGAMLIVGALTRPIALGLVVVMRRPDLRSPG